MSFSSSRENISHLFAQKSLPDSTPFIVGSLESIQIKKEVKLKQVELLQKLKERAEKLKFEKNGEVAQKTKLVDDNVVEVGSNSDDEDLLEYIPMNGIPWSSHGKTSHLPCIVQLHEEILQFYELVKEYQYERNIRNDILSRFQSIVFDFDGGAMVEPFGSFATGLMTPGSDLDIVITTDAIGDNRKAQQDYLSHLYHHLQRCKFTSSIHFIGRARVPIIKLVEKKHDQDIDISVNQVSGKGPAIEIIRHFLRSYPAMKYLVLVIKMFLKQRGLNDVATGGLSSYGVCLMVIAHLQHHSWATDENLSKVTSLGTLLIDFFALYGIHFNYWKVAIDVRNGGRFVPKCELRLIENKHWDPNAFRLCILDPSNPGNIVTYSTYRIEEVRNAFRLAAEAMLSGKHSSTSLLSRVIRNSEALLLRQEHVNFIKERAQFQERMQHAAREHKYRSRRKRFNAGSRKRHRY